MRSRAPSRIASIKQTRQEPLRNKSLEKTSGRVSHTQARGSRATVGYQKMGYPKQRSKNCLDPKNRTNGINKRGLGRHLRFTRDTVAEPRRKRTILPLARDRLAEAPSSRPPHPGPRKKCRFSDSREAGSAPAPWPPLQPNCSDQTSHPSTQPLRQTHDGTVRRSDRLHAGRINPLPSETAQSRGYRPLCCLTPAPRTSQRGESERVPVASESADRPPRLARAPPIGPRIH